LSHQSRTLAARLADTFFFGHQLKRFAMRFPAALRFLRRDAAIRSEPDPADLGTAFGLDACLDGSAVNEYRNQTQSDFLESQSSRMLQDSPLGWLSRRTA
jgi:hypothetical protein